MPLKKSLEEECRGTTRAYLLDQWDPAGNRPLTPQTISAASRAKAWWICDRGHRWAAAVQSRVLRETGCPFCAGRKVLAGENDLATLHPDLARQWDGEKNRPLTPDQVTAGSHKKVWWRCDRGHSWQAVVKARSDGAGCPFCANRAVLPGENDLATLHPDLAAQWDGAKNTPLTPDRLTPGSHKKVWWRCDRGHRWQAAVASRAFGGAGCPVCSGRQVLPGENDLSSLRPDLAAQWHPTKNGALTPEAVTAGSSRAAWWLCERGHAWQAVVARRVQANTGCPYCAGHKVLAGFNDLASQEPQLAQEWDRDLNGNLTPAMVTARSGKRVWWRCDQGHAWKTKVYVRTGRQRSGCPVCAGRTDRKRLEYLDGKLAGQEKPQARRPSPQYRGGKV